MVLKVHPIHLSPSYSSCHPSEVRAVLMQRHLSKINDKGRGRLVHEPRRWGAGKTQLYNHAIFSHFHTCSLVHRMLSTANHQPFTIVSLVPLYSSTSNPQFIMLVRADLCTTISSELQGLLM